jgi:hypothetical protein
LQVVSRSAVARQENQTGLRGQMVIGLVGGGLAFLQVLVLFVLSDLRDRIMRLETRQMGNAPAGD